MQEMTIILELKLLADVGLVGFPNAGKSSLLELFTNARPKIAPYPFTTKIPNLGVLRVDDEKDFIIADIPGIIEGASEGAGLGIRFLKHISRTSALLFMIDCSDEEEKCLSAYKSLLKEIENFGADLDKKPRIVLCNKIDVEGATEKAKLVEEEIHKIDKNIVVIPISVAARINVERARRTIIEFVDKLDAFRQAGKKIHPAEDEKKGKSSFLESRSVDESMEIQYPGQE